jgi:glycosidase
MFDVRFQAQKPLRCSTTAYAGVALVLSLGASACRAMPSPPEETAASAVSSGQTPAEAAGWRAQVIYLVMPDRFRNGDTTNDGLGQANCLDTSNPQKYHGGDLAGIRQNLDYIESVGATALWVTPVNNQIEQLSNGECGYHGYWIDYVDPNDGALEPKLGTSADLLGLVSDVHAAKMKFILDMVVNHTGNTAQLPLQQPSWFHNPKTCASLGDSLVDCPLDGHPDFAQEIPAVAAYESTMEAGWAQTYGIDGIRMDTTMYVAPSYFESSFFPAVRGVNPNLFTVGEIFVTGSTSAFVPYLDAGFDSAFHFELWAGLVSGIAKGGSVDDVARAVADGVQQLGMDRALDLVLLMDNHDVPRFANQPGYGVPEAEILRRELLALDLIFTLPGIPQLYYGDEVGMYGGPDPDNRRDLPAWVSDATARAQPHPGQAVAGSDQIFARVSKLAGLRTTTNALINGAYTELWRQNGSTHPNVFAFARGVGSGARIVVVSNGSAPSGMMHIPVPSSIAANGAVLTDALGDGAPASVTLTGGELVVNMPPRAAAIYVVP